MKKLLAIVVLGLLWGSSANARIILFKNCEYGEQKNFDKFEFKINTSKKQIESIQIYSDKWYEYVTKSNQYSGPKINKQEYNIDYYSPPYLKGTRDFVYKLKKRREELDFSLNNKKIIQTFFYEDGSNLSTEIKCK